jgi:hypothetical protein
MRKAILLLLCSSYIMLSYAQPSNDDCATPYQLELQLPGSCPSPFAVSDTFSLNNTDATTSEPFPVLTSCAGGMAEAGADVWVKFTALGNSMQFVVRGELNNPQMVLFQGNSCETIYPVACANGSNSLSLSTEVDRNTTYYLLISGQGLEDQGEIELVVSSANICNSCLLYRTGHFSASPAPINGTYPGGQSVQMCYTVTSWNASASGEFLHAVELDFGSGWDQASFVPAPPASCNTNGNWDWYDSWTSVSSNQTFGPGFAYDAQDFGFLDGNPGNNRGMGGNACGNIGIASPPLQFCWTITANDCSEETLGYSESLDVTARMLGDALSGSWGQTQCFFPADDDFLATIYCADPFNPDITVVDGSCFGACDGAVYIHAAGDGPWEYTLVDTTGLLLYNNLSVSPLDTISDLCTGTYLLTIEDLSSGQAREENIIITASQAPVASATYDLPCYVGEPIPLNGQSSPAQGASYMWFGPNEYFSTNQNPNVLYPGLYVLIVTVDGCESAPFYLEIPPIEESVVNIEQDTIIACPDDPLTLSASGSASNYAWYLIGTNELLGNDSTLTIIPQDGDLYQVNGMNEAGCPGSDQVYISVPFMPEVTTDNEGIICPGTTVTISANGGDTYSWSTGDSTSTISVSPEYTALYYLTVTGDGCTASFTINIPVSNSPAITISPDESICQGESIALFAGGGESVLWDNGENTSSIIVSPDSTTTYTAFITDANACVHEKSTTITVFPAPDLTIIPDSAGICSGDTVNIIVLEGEDIYWDTIVSPSQTTNYTIPGAELFGCQELGMITVEVFPLPDVQIQGGGTQCGTDSTLLVATGEGTFSWSTGDTGDSIYVSPVGAQTYSVTATSAEGCTQSNSVVVNQADAPETPVVSCEAELGQVLHSWDNSAGYTVNISVIDGPTGLSISNDQYLVSGLLPGQSSTIQLTLLTPEGCSATTTSTCTALNCEDLDVSISVPSAVCINEGVFALEAQLTNGTATGIGVWSGAGVEGPSFDPAVAGPGVHEVVFTYNDNGCTISTSSSVSVTEVLSPEMVSCTADTSTVVFSWPFIDGDTAYTVTLLSQGNGYLINDTTYVVDSLMNGDTALISITSMGNAICASHTIEASCTIEYDNCPPLTVKPDTISCGGSPIQLWADVEGWDTFSWSPATSLSCTDCPAPVASPTTTTTYTVIASNENGCMDTAMVTIYIGEIPSIYIPDEPITYCEGESLELCIPDGDLELWIKPSGEVVFGPCLSFENLTAEDEGNYYAYLRIGDCRFGKFFRLVAAPAIVVNSITDFQTACPDSTFVLGVDASNAEQYFWSPAEYLDCPDCAETTGSVPQTATFSLQLTDEYGCMLDTSATVFVEECQPLPQPVLPPTETVYAQQQDINIYPIPAADVLNLDIPIDGEKQIQLFSPSGQLTARAQSSDYQFSLPLHHIENGAYLLRIITTEGVFNEWIIVNKG